MFNDSTIEFQDAELHAYNAAFHELGLRWYWDRATYQALLSRSDDARRRIGIYLEDSHPHLLRAYDADFLVDAIESRKMNYLRHDELSGLPVVARFDWSTMRAAEIGA